MPNDTPGEGIKREGVQQTPEDEAVHPPPPPDSPSAPPAQPIIDKGVGDAVQAIEDRVRRAEWLMIWLTAAIALFALCAVIVGILQWSAMRDAVTIDQRAWLTVTRFQLPSEPREGKPIQVLFWLQNTGKTPALDEYAESALIAAPPEPPFTALFRSALHFRNNIIPPGIGNAVSRSELWTPSSAELMPYIGKTAQLYIHARIIYSDVFGASHWTSVCAFHTYGDPPDTFYLCARGNDMDRDKRK